MSPSQSKRRGTARRRPQLGFTLVELVIVLAVMGLLASMAVPMYQTLIITSKKSERAIVIRNMEEAFFSYLNDHQQQFQYPSGTDSSWTWLSYNPPPPFNGVKKPFVPTVWGWNDFAYQPSGDLYYHYYAYGSITPGFSYFYVATVGDLDGNGVLAYYYKYWYRDGAGAWYTFWEFTFPKGEE
jgi:prepilin-type N-terminal cleavage/methylation domain-containing protein